MKRSPKRGEDSHKPVRRLLPPPPDVHNVIQVQEPRSPQSPPRLTDITAPDESVASTPKLLQSIESKLRKAGFDIPVQETQQVVDLRNVIAELKFNKAGKLVKSPSCISAENTTIIGDFTIDGFVNPDSKWLVQSFSKAVLKTIPNRIENNQIQVQHRYVFLGVDANQVFRATRAGTFQQIKVLITAIRNRNQNGKIFMVGVLPRPSHNELAKPYIKDFNRFVAASVKRLGNQFARLVYILVQIWFQQVHEFHALFQEDMVRLNEFGRMKYKRVLLEQAGFVKNKV